MSATTPDDMPDVPFVPNANPYGPSDSSDTASERPSGDVESDAAGTGERASADPPYVDDVADDAPDIRPDKAVDADDAGVSWAQADLTLAPLSAGDYVVRVAVTHPTGTSRSLTGFRVVP